MSDPSPTDREAAIARAKAVAAARRPSGTGDERGPSPDDRSPGAAPVASTQGRSRSAGPSAARILAAAGATAAGVALVGVLAVSAQRGAAASEPAPAPVPVAEYRTVVIQVPAGTQAGDPLVNSAVSAVAAEQPAPVAAGSNRTPAARSEGS